MKSKIEDEFLRAYDEYADAIFRHCLFRVYDRETARDLVQDTFMKTWEYLAGGNEVDNIRAFLYRVATNLIIDSRRKKSGKDVSLDKLLEDGVQFEWKSDSDTGRQIDARQLVRLLDELDEIYREAVFMRYVEDLAPREIALIVGESENAVSVRIHRGLNKFKQLLKEKGYDTDI